MRSVSKINIAFFFIFSLILLSFFAVKTSFADVYCDVNGDLIQPFTNMGPQTCGAGTRCPCGLSAGSCVDPDNPGEIPPVCNYTGPGGGGVIGACCARCLAAQTCDASVAGGDIPIGDCQWKTCPQQCNQFTCPGWGACRNAPANTCDANNGTQSRSCPYTRYNGSTNCDDYGRAPHQETQDCTVDNCTGDFTCTAGTCGVQITAHVYKDYNHNGQQDAGEPNYGGVDVQWWGHATQTTGGNGNTIFNVPTGARTFQVNIPAGWDNSTNDVVTLNLDNNSKNQTINFGLTEVYSLSGNIFTDVNLNQQFDTGTESNYTDSTTIHVTGGPTNVTDMTQTTGTYATPQNLWAGTYHVTIDPGSLPAGWRATTSTTWIVTVGDTTTTGPQCATGGSLDAVCGNPNNGSISKLDFGLTNETAWKQPICGDTRYNSGYSESIPSGASCNNTSAPYAIMNDANICPTNPGILFSGGVNPNYGNGTGASTTNLQVGNTSFPESFNYRLPNTSDTSYNFVTTTITTQGTPTIPLTSICPNLTTCTLSEGTPGGVYTTTAADGPVSISVSNGDASYNLGQANYSFVIGNDLTFKTPLTLQASSAAVFTSAGNIHVDGHVGNVDYTSTSPNLEGLFSADQNFDIDTITTGLNLCQASGQPLDKKLNIKGSVIAGAGGSGSVVNNREGCLQDLTCPNITILPDPIQLLRFTSGLPGDNTNYAGGALKTPYSFWQELNP